MRKILVPVLLLACALPAFGRSTAPGKGSGIPDGGGSEPISLGKADKAAGTIRGHCTLVDASELTSPCSNIVIVLLDEEGNEVARTRTSSKGGFKFAADAGRTYHLRAGSKSYDLLAPTTEISGGDSVEMKLRSR